MNTPSTRRPGRWKSRGSWCARWLLGATALVCAALWLATFWLIVRIVAQPYAMLRVTDGYCGLWVEKPDMPSPLMDVPDWRGEHVWPRGGLAHLCWNTRAERQIAESAWQDLLWRPLWQRPWHHGTVRTGTSKGPIVRPYANCWLIIPLWMPFVVCASISGLAWWRHTHRKRIGCCPICGYDQSGLSVGSVCPECGAAP